MELITKDAVINNLAKGEFEKLIGKKVTIIDTKIINAQVSDVKIALRSDPSHPLGYIPKRMIYVVGEPAIHEDYTIFSWQSMRTMTALKQWLTPTTYTLGDYVGIEKLCWELAHLDSHLVIDVQPMNPNIINPNIVNPTIIKFYMRPRLFDPNNPASDLTITTVTAIVLPLGTIYSLSVIISDEPFQRNSHRKTKNPKKYIGHQDPWLRSMLWTSHVVALITDDPSPLASIASRVKWAKFMRKQMNLAQQTILNVIRSNIVPDTSCFIESYPYITVCVNSWSLPVSTVGKYGHPLYYAGEEDKALADYKSDFHKTIRFYGEFTIHEAIFTGILKENKLRKPGDDQPYYKYILMHEMIHAIYKEKCADSNHGPGFQQIADSVSLPIKYRG
jgi:hypothetical protein